VNHRAVDLYDPVAVDELCDEIRSLGDPVRYLVKAAGTFLPTAFLERTPEDYDKFTRSTAARSSSPRPRRAI